MSKPRQPLKWWAHLIHLILAIASSGWWVLPWFGHWMYRAEPGGRRIGAWCAAGAVALVIAFGVGDRIWLASLTEDERGAVLAERHRAREEQDRIRAEREAQREEERRLNAEDRAKREAEAKEARAERAAAEKKADAEWRCNRDRAGAWTAAKEFVERRLKAPSTAEFPWITSATILPVEGCMYRVMAYLDAQNSFGAMIRSNWTAKVERIDGGWQAIEVLILE